MRPLRQRLPPHRSSHELSACRPRRPHRSARVHHAAPQRLGQLGARRGPRQGQPLPVRRRPRPRRLPPAHHGLPSGPPHRDRHRPQAVCPGPRHRHPHPRGARRRRAGGRVEPGRAGRHAPGADHRRQRGRRPPAAQARPRRRRDGRRIRRRRRRPRGLQRPVGHGPVAARALRAGRAPGGRRPLPPDRGHRRREWPRRPGHPDHDPGRLPLGLRPGRGGPVHPGGLPALR